MKGENNMGKSMLNGECYGSDDANDIVYDNTTSGLTATNTQGAIDELATSVTELNSNLEDININLPFKLGIDENGNYGYIKEGADTVTPFKKGTISFSKVHQFTGDNVTNYACGEDCYYLCVACGYYNSTSLSTGTITTSCSVTQVSSDKSYVSIWLVNGVKGQNIKLHVTGGGVGAYKFIIFKLTFG